jgi:L-seryl-tRNA(Ser) seleniumtransferase
MPAAVGTGFTVSLCDCRSQIGSGALPLDTIASAGLAIRSHAGAGALNQLAASLRGLPRPIIGRLAGSALTLDLRCLTDEADFLSVLTTLEAERRLRPASPDAAP